MQKTIKIEMSERDGNAFAILGRFQNEAKKYKSAEEFIEAQGEKLIHITESKNVKSINKSGIRYAQPKEGSISEGISLTGKKTGTNKIFGDADIDVYLNPNIKSVTMTEALDGLGFQKERIVSTTGLKDAERKAIQWAKDNGYDVIDMRDAKSSVYAGMDEVRIINPNPSILKTKSQLTDIWNKANKE